MKADISQSLNNANEQLKQEIAKRKQAEQILERFCNIGKILCDKRKIDELLPLIMSEISKTLNADRTTLFLIPWERMHLRAKYAEGMKDDPILLCLEMGLVGACVLTRQPVNVAEAYKNPRFNPEIDRITGFRTESVLCTPLVNRKQEIVGAVELLNKRTGVFTEEDESEALKSASLLAETDYSGADKARDLVCDLRRFTESERCSLFLINHEKSEIFSVITEGLDRDICLSLKLGIAGYVALTGQYINIQEAYADPRFDKTADERTGYCTHSVLCAPVKNQSGEAIGIIETINKKQGVFTDSDMDILKALSSYVSMFVENAIISDEYHQQFKSMLEVLAASIDAKDPLTAGHSERVNEYAVGIARELGFKDAETDILSVSALLHDYGKIGIDENILKKPGKLTPEEYEHIKKHAVKTRDILNKMNFIRKYHNVPFIASCHHECPDGSGYPDGIRGNEIPFMARIIAVADVFEALTARRHYREALSSEQAFEILEQGIDTKFDGNIIAALKKYWKRVSG